MIGIRLFIFRQTKKKWQSGELKFSIYSFHPFSWFLFSDITLRHGHGHVQQWMMKQNIEYEKGKIYYLLFESILRLHDTIGSNILFERNMIFSPTQNIWFQLIELLYLKIFHRDSIEKTDEIRCWAVNRKNIQNTNLYHLQKHFDVGGFSHHWITTTNAQRHTATTEFEVAKNTICNAHCLYSLFYRSSPRIETLSKQCGELNIVLWCRKYHKHSDT